MTDNVKNALNQSLQYRSPEVKVIFVKTQGILCFSDGNEPMREYDFGDGGFGE